DDAAIDPKHAYALYASIVDAKSTWQNTDAVPVITGGPTSGLDVTLPLAATAVVIAALVKSDTGTLVNRDVHPVPTGGALSFSIPVDPTLLAPTATYVVKAA